MTEGPRARAYAITIAEKCIGKIVRSVMIRSRKTSVEPSTLVSRRLVKADSWGKNILLFIDDIAIRIHPMMYGRVVVQNSGLLDSHLEKRVRLMINFDDCWVIAINTPIVEVDQASRVLEFLSNSLGPDPYRLDWDGEEALRRLLSKPEEKIGVALLDQSIVAGIGNILRNEILFRAGISPERKISDLTMNEARGLIRIIENIFIEYLDIILRGDRLRNHYDVYNRYRGKCPRCKGPLKYYRQSPVNRKTFFCPTCQT